MKSREQQRLVDLVSYWGCLREQCTAVSIEEKTVLATFL